jgi:hypothetical protein
MQIKVQDLAQNGFVEIDSIHHKELLPFVKTYLRKKTFSSIFYNIMNGTSGALLVIIYWIYESQFKLEDALSHFSYGIGMAFLLIPIHEYIHVLAYRSQGAKETSYDANFKKFYFMALANGFVANKKEFRIVALAPFVSISLVLLIMLFIVPLVWKFTCLGVFMTHTLCCGGDFSLMSYFEFHKDKTIVTYDNIEEGRSYFLALQTPDVTAQ